MCWQMVRATSPPNGSDRGGPRTATPRVGRGVVGSRANATHTDAMDNSSDQSDSRKVRKADLECADAMPPSLLPHLDAIPSALSDRKQWVCWRHERRRDKLGHLKWTKVPVDPKSGRNASPTNSGTWGDFTSAVAYLRAHPSELAGIGYVFSSDDPFTGVDLDNARDAETANLFPWASAIVADLDTYAEVSPSGTGVKLFAVARKPGTKCRRSGETGEVDMYSEGRYFAVTGHRLAGTPADVLERQSAIDRLYARLFGNGIQESAPETAHVEPLTGSAGAADLTDQEIV